MPVSPARAAAFDILLRVEQQDAYASELLHSDRLDKLSVADRGLTTEIVMGVLRWRSRVDDAIAAQSSRPLGKLDPQVLTALRIAAYQLLYLSRVPARAAINESVDLVKRARKVSAAPFANAVLRKLANASSGAVTEETSRATAASLAHEFAHPAWLVERWVDHLGIDNAEVICRHDQRIPTTSIRLDGAAVEGELQTEGIELAPGALLTSARIVTHGDVTQTRVYREDRVFIQDEASQLVAALVGTGSRLLDCCAAPGSKTAVIASRNPASEIIAVELHPHRAELLRRRVRATNVQVITADALHLTLLGGFDRVLADVPCSGTGTLARNPEIKWRLKPEDLNDLHMKQVAILRAALQQLAPGGRAIYSTCSLEPEENQSVVEEVLQADQNVTLLDCRNELEQLRAAGELASNDLDVLLDGNYLRTLPGVHPCDGFFAAILHRQS
ncbi:MAG TPA: 16S rRNA (cytosine(967)-C(5))-methyltransferase RsmB [Terriglobales bacterium]